MSDHSTKQCTRRDFISAAVGGLGAVLAVPGIEGDLVPVNSAASMIGFKAPPVEVVRIGFVGVGGMGSAHIKNLLNIEGVEIRAVGDIVEDRVARIQEQVTKAGKKRPEAYVRGAYDFKRMCERQDLDLIYTATPWEWHVPIALAAMNAGKHVATEVPAAVTVEECWQLVETAEKMRRHCVMMENCCYDRPEMMCLNMVKKGLLGEILHAEAGYLHDLRSAKFGFSKVILFEHEWRLAHSIKRNGNLYPTHGLGPVSQCMDINRGDSFEYLVSMSTKSRGLNLYAAKKFGPEHPKAREKYSLGDVNVSLIHTAKGRVITLYHDCSSPRPYSRIHKVQGTQGIFEKYPERVYIEDRSPLDEWESLEKYQEYDHPLWNSLGERTKGAAGHGGMDYFEDYRLIQALRNGKATDLDVYDAVAWSVVSPLSEQSVANKGRAIEFPDFTRGSWESPRALAVMEM